MAETVRGMSVGREARRLRYRVNVRGFTRNNRRYRRGHLIDLTDNPELAKRLVKSGIIAEISDD